MPAWLRPYQVLSNGERFRADLARIISEAPARVTIDEFTSPLDRQVAKFGALAFQKAWRRGAGQALLLSCHYDVIDWLEPDWIFDTATGKYAGRGLWRRPRFELRVYQTDWRHWPLFEPHHYLKLPPMVAATCYVGAVEGELVAHVAFSTRPGMHEARACRLVVMPEWQGAGVGLRFLSEICAMQERGDEHARLPGRKQTTIFHTSHPQLCAALRRDKRWRQISCSMYGGNKNKSGRSVQKSKASGGAARKFNVGSTGYGGHLRAVQGFRYYGKKGLDAHV